MCVTFSFTGIVKVRKKPTQSPANRNSFVSKTVELREEVGVTGLEPVTSCMSSKHSKPTELYALTYRKSRFRRGSKLYRLDTKLGIGSVTKGV